MKLNKETRIYQLVFNDIKAFNQDDVNKVVEQNKNNPNIKDYKIATIWRFYRFIHNNNETIKEEILRLNKQGLKDSYIDTMMFSIFKEMNWSLYK